MGNAGLGSGSIQGSVLQSLRNGFPAHCECMLIEYLCASQEGPWRDTPPFSYLGVSKLSCNACRIWIKSFNKQGAPSREFYTCGSHGKWYWPWAMEILVGSEGMQHNNSVLIGQTLLVMSSPGIEPGILVQQWLKLQNFPCSSLPAPCNPVST